MKTRIEVSDPLLREAHKLPERQGVTLRLLVEWGFVVLSPRQGQPRPSSCAAPASRAGAFSPFSTTRRGISCVNWAMRVAALDRHRHEHFRHAHREDSPFHDAASKRIAELTEGPATWSIPWPCTHEFLSIVTHPRIYAPPTPLRRALDRADAWLEAPTLVLLAESEAHWPSLRALIVARRIAGAQVPDARIATLVIVSSMGCASFGRRIATSTGSRTLRW
jgi:uncharacterized protein